jgi:hypothetical protein
MNSNRTSLTRALATLTLIVVSASSSFGRSDASVPDVVANEVAQAFDRLAAENDKRTHAAIDASVAALLAGALDTVPAMAPAKSQPVAVVEVHLPRANRAQRRLLNRG